MQRSLAILIGTIVLAISTAAVSAERMFMPVPSSNQEIVYIKGDAALVSNIDSARIAITFVPRDKKTAWVKIWALNTGQSTFNITEQSITASSSGIPVIILTYADRVKELKKKEMWANIGAGFAAAGNNMNAANAGRSTTYGTYNERSNVSAYGSSGYATGTVNTTGTYTATTYNPATAQQAQAVANERNQQMFAQTRAESADAFQDLDNRALRATTLMPEQSVMGDVRIILPKKAKMVPTEMTVTVDLAGQRIEILFRENP